MDTFPFGKFKGYEFYEVPINYIVWTIENVDNDELIYYLKDHLLDRLQLNPKPIQHVVKIPENIQSIYRQLCKKYHPDFGGNAEAMKAINEFMELIKRP